MIKIDLDFHQMGEDNILHCRWNIKKYAQDKNLARQ